MGSLQTTPLPLLLLGLQRDGFTGPLTLASGSVRKRVSWQRGQPVAVDSNQADEDLISVLFAEGSIAATDAVEITACMQERGWDALRAVAALKKAGPRELVAGLAAQIRRALVSCFAWQEGSFEMAFETEGAAAPTLPVDLLRVLHEGVATHWPIERVLESLGERATLRPTPAASFAAILQRLPESPALRSLQTRIDGSVTAFEAVQQDPQASVWAALWVLDATGALDWPSAGDAPESEETTSAEPELEIIVHGGDTAEHDGAQAARSQERAVREDRAVELEAQVLGLHGRLSDIDHYELLGLERGADHAQIKRAYLKAAKRLHPDRLTNFGLEEIKEQANDVFARIASAHKTLSDVDARREYDASLDGHSTIDVDRVAQAEVFFLKGEALLRAGNFRDAVELLESAVQVWPEEADYQSALAWALHRRNPPDNERALAHFEKALELGGENARTLLRMSFAVKEVGDRARANELSARALQLDPSVKP